MDGAVIADSAPVLMAGLILALIYTIVALIGALCGFIVSWFMFRN